MSMGTQGTGEEKVSSLHSASRAAVLVPRPGLRVPTRQSCGALSTLGKSAPPTPSACSNQEHHFLLRLENTVWTGECFSLVEKQIVSWLVNH